MNGDHSLVEAVDERGNSAWHVVTALQSHVKEWFHRFLCMMDVTSLITSSPSASGINSEGRSFIGRWRVGEASDDCVGSARQGVTALQEHLIEAMSQQSRRSLSPVLI